MLRDEVRGQTRLRRPEAGHGGTVRDDRSRIKTITLTRTGVVYVYGDEDSPDPVVCLSVEAVQDAEGHPECSRCGSVDVDVRS
jgi:hypothetical protein